MGKGERLVTPRVGRTSVGPGIRLLRGVQGDTEGGQMARSGLDLGRESPVEPRSPREEPGEQAGRPHFEALQYLTQATKGTYVKSGRKVPGGWEGQGRQDNSTGREVFRKGHESSQNGLTLKMSQLCVSGGPRLRAGRGGRAALGG